MTPRGDSGFTLVEVLVALAVFSILSTATMAAMLTTFRTREAVDVNLQRVEAVAALDQMLREDFANVITRPTRDSYGTAELVSFQTFPPDGALIRFTREGRTNPGGIAPRGDLMRVAYRLDGDRFVRETPAMPTPAVNTPMTRRVLFEGVSRADVTAFVNGAQSLQVNVPPGSPDLPQRVRLTLETDRGSLVHELRVGR